MPLKMAYRWLDWLAHRRGWSFLVLLLMILGATLLLGLSRYQSDAGAEERRNAYEALLGLERLLSVLKDAETGQRGFLLTGKIEYLEPYNSAVARVRDRIDYIHRYRPFPPGEVDELEIVARDKLAELATTITLFREGRREEALAVVRSDRGKHFMDAARRQVALIQATEQRRLEASQRAMTIFGAMSYAGFLTLIPVVVATIVFLGIAYGREEKARRAAEDEMVHMAIRATTINRVAPGAIITADIRGHVVEWNPAAAHTFGWEAHEIIGRPLSTLMPERYRADHEAGVAHAFRAGRIESDRPREVHGLRKDGTEFPADVFVDVFAVDGNQYSIGIVRDITPRKHAEAEQTRLRDELARSNDELQQFAYIASHDLQEPLRMVDKFVGKLAEKYAGLLDEQGREYIGFAREGARRMQDLIQDLLRYSRVTTRAHPFQVVDLGQIYRDIARDLSDRVEREHGHIALATGLPAVVGEAFQLRQLFQNLIDNALKYHRQDVPPIVTVACSGESEVEGTRCPCWHFTVADNGIGIEPDQAGMLFQLFARLHAREEYEGTGIGLAICKKIVERHGGRIWIESTPGEGSTFHFTLPKEQKG